ncbi:MAG: hypothetical protein AAF677_17485, partial [Pseudomonadota bacterium]
MMSFTDVSAFATARFTANAFGDPLGGLLPSGARGDGPSGDSPGQGSDAPLGAALWVLPLQAGPHSPASEGESPIVIQGDRLAGAEAAVDEAPAALGDSTADAAPTDGAARTGGAAAMADPGVAVDPAGGAGFGAGGGAGFG